MRSTSCSAVERLYHKYKDHDATFYLNATKTDPLLPVYSDRPGMAWYSTRNSTKLSYLVYLVHETYNKQGRKIVLFWDWPTTA